jgi:hypothetical protein
MAISAGTVTLADYAQMSNSPLVQAVSFSLIDNGSVIADIPLVSKKSFTINGARFEGNLPSVNWSQINAEGVSTKGTPTPYQEQVYILRNYIDVDKYIVEEENAIVDPRATQTEAYLKALTYDVNYKFIANDHVTGDLNAPVGLAYRINNGGTYGVRAENKIDGGGVDLSLSGMTQATANHFLVYLDQLLWSVDSPQGNGVVLYMNEVMQRQFAAAIRTMGTSGGFSVMQDQFGRTIQMYKGAVVRDIGYKADQSTRIIPGNGVAGSGAIGETAAGVASTGSSAVYTSIYAVNYSTDHFFGWQFDAPNVQDLGLINNGVIYRTLIDWAVGLVNASTRSIARLYDVKLA